MSKSAVNKLKFDSVLFKNIYATRSKLSLRFVTPDQYGEAIWCLRGHDFECQQREFELDTILHRQPVHLGEYWCNVFTSMRTSNGSSKRILYTLQLMYISHG